MRTTEEIDKALATAKKKDAELKSRLAENASEVTLMREDSDERVRNGVADSDLDELDLAIFKTERQGSRIKILLDESHKEISHLIAERGAAELEELRIAYAANAAALLIESKDIESLVQAVISLVASKHAPRLEQMRRQVEGFGVTQIPFRLSNLENRITAAFRNTGDKVYRQPYDQIIAGNIESVAKQMKTNADGIRFPNGSDAPEAPTIN